MGLGSIPNRHFGYSTGNTYRSMTRAIESDCETRITYNDSFFLWIRIGGMPKFYSFSSLPDAALGPAERLKCEPTAAAVAAERGLSDASSCAVLPVGGLGRPRDGPGSREVASEVGQAGVRK